MIASRPRPGGALQLSARWILASAILISLSVMPACAYLHSSVKQMGYAFTHRVAPSQHNLKHMIKRQSYFVYGRVIDEQAKYGQQTLLVAAFCNKYKTCELVDSTHVANVNTHYGLNLPEGEFDVAIFADQDGDGFFDESEVIGETEALLNANTYPDYIAANVDIELGQLRSKDRSLHIPVPEPPPVRESVFYPQGTIRALDDQLFDRKVAMLGMYEPAAFLELAPTMFYALEEDSYKIPVVFVHGIGGSAREFAAIVNRLDRRVYQPWFFYYPSGKELNQLAALFYDLFLSGAVNPRREMPLIIVAHSMGGLVVQEALNRLRGVEQENRVGLFVSLATPFGGHPAAATGVERAPLVIPCWLDLDPDSMFVRRLFRKTLEVDHHLFYAEGGSRARNRLEKSDGVVPVTSQRRAEALAQSRLQVGFNTSHVGILEDEQVIRRVLESMGTVASIYPDSHLEILATGGYDVELAGRYSEQVKYYIRNMGKYFTALANGTLSPQGNSELERFVKISRGQLPAEYEMEKAWLSFQNEYPQYGPACQSGCGN